jgi:hypothetical protein
MGKKRPLSNAVFSREDLRRDWYRLIEIGPRFPGTSNEAKAIAYISDQLQNLPYQVSYHEYAYLGWALNKPPCLRVLEPTAREMHCQAYIYCAPTPPGGIRGTVEPIGEHWVIGDYRWEKLAVRDDRDKVVAYVSARPDGPAMPQPLSERSSLVPHFSIGTGDHQQFIRWINTGKRIVVEGEIDAQLNPEAKSKNVIASFNPQSSSQSKIVLCAHLDSMYICPGANDNAGGVAALLALARYYAQRGLDFAIEFIFFNAEEWDLAGSKAYVRDFITRENAQEIKMLLNLDGISEVGESLQIWVGPEGFEHDLKAVIDQFVHPRAVEKIYKFPPPLGADHVPFYNMGVPVIMFTGYDMVKYHLPIDTFWEGGVDNIAYVTELTRHIIDQFAGRELDYPTRESILAPYRDSPAEGILSFKLI